MIENKLWQLFPSIEKNLEQNQYIKARLVHVGVLALETIILIQEVIKVPFKALGLIFEALPLALRACVRLIGKNPKAWGNMDTLLIITPQSLGKSTLKVLYLIPCTISSLFFGIFFRPELNLWIHDKLELSPKHINEFKLEVLRGVDEEKTSFDPL